MTDRQVRASMTDPATGARAPGPYDLAQRLLRSGDLAAGWAEFARARRARGHYDAMARRLPFWTGGRLDGPLLVVNEHGLGDTIQAWRFLPVLRARGLALTMTAPDPLLRLLAFQGFGEVVPLRAGALDPRRVAAMIPQDLLPAVMGETLETIPPAPYLRAPKEPVPPMRASAGRRIGIVWRTRSIYDTAAARSVDAHALVEALAGHRLHSLQPDADPPRGVEDLRPLNHDMADCAALMAGLDLVVTIDSAAAHLAGALGLPAIVLVSRAADWRWFDERTDSPFYPSLRLARQRRVGDWSDALAALPRLVEEMT